MVEPAKSRIKHFEIVPPKFFDECINLEGVVCWRCCNVDYGPKSIQDFKNGFPWCYICEEVTVGKYETEKDQATPNHPQTVKET